MEVENDICVSRAYLRLLEQYWNGQFTGKETSDKSRHYIIENPFVSFSKCIDRLLRLFLWSLDLVISLKLNCSLRNLSQRYCGYLCFFFLPTIFSVTVPRVWDRKVIEEYIRLLEEDWIVDFFSRYTVSDPNETPYFYFILCCFIFPFIRGHLNTE